VIVPCFNEDPAVIARSFAALRAQSFADFECVVVDDSTDPQLAFACEAACATDPRFAYVRPGARLGIAGSLNRAIERARGGLIARADCDDVCHPERLRRQLDFLEGAPEVGILGCALGILDDPGRPGSVRAYPLGHEAIARRMQLTNAMAHPTVMMRRTVLDRCGGYDPTFRYCEDLELWLRLINAGVRFANLPDALVAYRQETTDRPAGNWRDNLRARLKHLSAHMLARRLIGIVAIAVWSATPPAVRRLAYRRLIFDRAR
jgi:GT2 family glycosyltransferase